MDYNKQKAIEIASIYGAYLNQSGSALNTQPSAIFINNMNQGFLNFGVSFLINRRAIIQNTLSGLQSAGTNPLWQQLLINKITYIDILLKRANNSGTGDLPCPPTDKNSPLYNTDNFCNSDWCVDGQGNPSQNAHPDCRCCDDTSVGTGDDPCKDPNWVNLQWGGNAGQPNYNNGKNNYCDRCSAGNGSFPVIWSNGQWNYDPTNGTDYCNCCKPQTNTGGTDRMKDCYHCNKKGGVVMNRVSVNQPCPKGWSSSLVNITTGLSDNPCGDRPKGITNDRGVKVSKNEPILPIPSKPTKREDIGNSRGEMRGFGGQFMIGDY